MPRLMRFWIPKLLANSSKIDTKISLDHSLFFPCFRHRFWIDFYRFLNKKWRFFGRGHMSKLTHLRRERFVQKHCKIHIKVQIVMYQMYQRASSCWLRYYKSCIWKWALLRSLILNQFGNSFGIQKGIKRGIETMLTCNLPKVNDRPPKKSALLRFPLPNRQPRPPPPRRW